MDSEDFYDKDKHSKFIMNTIAVIILEKQNACTKCNVISIDKWYGVVGFESNHVDKNFQKKDKETRKTFEIECGEHSQHFENVGGGDKYPANLQNMSLICDTHKQILKH